MHFFLLPFISNYNINTNLKSVYVARVDYPVHVLFLFSVLAESALLICDEYVPYAFKFNDKHAFKRMWAS